MSQLREWIRGYFDSIEGLATVNPGSAKAVFDGMNIDILSLYLLEHILRRLENVEALLKAQKVEESDGSTGKQDNP